MAGRHHNQNRGHPHNHRGAHARHIGHPLASTKGLVMVILVIMLLLATCVAVRHKKTQGWSWWASSKKAGKEVFGLLAGEWVGFWVYSPGGALNHHVIHSNHFFFGMEAYVSISLLW